MKKTEIKLKDYVGLEDRMNASVEIADIVMPENGEYKPHFDTIAEFLVFCKYFLDGIELEEDDDLVSIYDADKELRKMLDEINDVYMGDERGGIKDVWFSVTSRARDLIYYRTEMSKKVDLESKYERLINKQIEYETARIELVAESLREKKISNDILEKMSPETIVALSNSVADGTLNPQNIGIEILKNYKGEADIVPFPGLEDDLK